MSMPEESFPVKSCPEDFVIENELRNIVSDLFHSQNVENLTIRRVRTAAENKLNLEPGFLKSHSDWKEKSRAIINEEVKKLEGSITCQTTEKVPNETIDSQITEQDVTNNTHRNTSLGNEDSLPHEQLSNEPNSHIKHPESVQSDESGYYMVRDEPPPSKKARKLSTTGVKGSKAKSSGQKRKLDSTADLSSEEQEIKRLQGWLLKCGIRKLWHKELQKYNSAQDKIKHLRQMLKDIGMTGRFSTEKAKQIKEKRELEADLEDVITRNEVWGSAKSKSTDQFNSLNNSRKLARGFKDLAFLEDDEEETE